MERYACIHGHFYQPPRENPWLEAIEFQDPARPYHDWNEKITAECYAPNAISRILDEKGRIALMVNNYTKINFNFGPTLLAWLEKRAPEVYEAILEADRESQKTCSGHGSAIAQAYNHVIMPLANSRDKRTQVIWGIKDFEHRFGRKPEGMWLPETGVDLETLDILAEYGITFTILAPHQAKRIRKIGEKGWKDVSEAKVDPTMPYRCSLPSGKTINLFFFDSPISHDVAFGDLLNSGEAFVARLMGAFSDREGPQLVHIATDGETYGHHHRFGDMALAYALHSIESQKRAQITNYGEYMEKHPSSHEAEIFERTSWSCVHGIERWQSDCGCNTGRHPEWHQAWRASLREALDWLRDALAPAYEEKARSLVKDPWAARNAYIRIILDRSPKNMDVFFTEHAARALNDAERILALKLMELQRQALFMYTSCGWFFDDLSGIETVQILRYAGRAVQLAQEIFGDDLEPQFLKHLERAKGNIPDHRDGRRIYEKFVKPAMADLKDVGAHYAVSSLFEEYPERASIYCYTIDRKDYQITEAGKTRLGIGRARVTSQITRESAELCFGVVHGGDHTMNCGIKEYGGEEDYQAMVQQVSDAFAGGDFPELIRLMDKHFGASPYSLKSLFRDEQRRIVDMIMESTVQEAENEYRQLYASHAPMMRFLKELGIPAPKALYTAVEVSLNASLRRAFEDKEFDPGLIGTLLEETGEIGISLDTDTLEYTFRKKIERMAEGLLKNPSEIPRIQQLAVALELVGTLPFPVNLWKVQNIFYEMLQDVYAEFRGRAEQGDTHANEWINNFKTLGEKLYVRIE